MKRRSATIELLHHFGCVCDRSFESGQFVTPAYRALPPKIRSDDRKHFHVYDGYDDDEAVMLYAVAQD